MQLKFGAHDLARLAELLHAGVAAKQAEHGDALRYVPTLRRLEKQVAKRVRLSDAKNPTNSTPRKAV